MSYIAPNYLGLRTRHFHTSMEIVKKELDMHQDSMNVPPPTPEEQAELNDMYAQMDQMHMKPLWNQIGNLMPEHPTPEAVPYKWDWSTLHKLAERSGELVPVGRGGERRAIGLANPGLHGETHVAPTLWAAIQYLAPGENAPEHRHSQNAFRFVIEGEGVWTVVNGDATPHAPWRLSADPRMELPRPPQHRQRTYGMAGRSGYSLPVQNGHRLLRIRHRTPHR